jgi:hypothetical protein
MKRVNTDVEIYIHSLMEGINQLGLIDELIEEWGLRDVDEFKEVLAENFTIEASVNFEEKGNPVLDEEQFTKTLNTSLTEYTLDSLTEEGILIKNLKEGETENTYTLSPEAKINLDGEEGN